MSIEKIIAEAIENNPLRLKEAFEDEMNARIRTALEAKYKEMTSPEAVAEATEEEVEEAHAMNEASDEEEEGEEFDEKGCVAELKKRHADGESQADCVNAVKEKYGCSSKVANELYASNCGG